MFDVGFAEIFLLSLVGLLVLGPERLPAVARTLGGLVRKARTSWYNLKRTIETEMDAADVTAPLKSAGEELKKVGTELSRDLDPVSRPDTTAGTKTDNPKAPGKP